MKRMIVFLANDATEPVYSGDNMFEKEGFLTFYTDSSGEFPVYYAVGVVVAIKSVTSKQWKEYQEAIKEHEKQHELERKSQQLAEDHTPNLEVPFNVGKEV